jgi:hypothetical protein
MPPKKKAPKPDEPAPAETQAKPAEKVEPVPEVKKEEVKPLPQPTPPAVQTPLSRLEQGIAAEQTQAKPEAVEQKTQKIAIDDVSKLSEEEKLELRRLRFGTLGTETTADEAERVSPLLHRLSRKDSKSSEEPPLKTKRPSRNASRSSATWPPAKTLS